MNDIIKYRRGSVWMREQRGHRELMQPGLQSNNRPHLIISSDEGNRNNSTVVCLKITSQSHKTCSINVPFVNENEEDNLILCNQVETVSKSELTRYMFTLSDEVMKKVEKAFLIACSMDYTQKDVYESLNELKDLVRQLNSTEIFNSHNNPNLQMMKEIRESLKSLYKDCEYVHNNLDKIDPMSVYRAKKEVLNNDVSKSNVSFEEPTKDEPPASCAPATPLTPAPKKTETIRPRGFWSQENILQFVKDKDSMSPEELRKKWNFETVKKCMDNYYNFKSKAKKAGWI